VTSVRRRVWIAALCLVAAAAVTLMASDVLRWQHRVDVDDQRFAAVPERAELWRVRPLAPFAPTRFLLGLDDDLAYRRAVHAFVRGRPRLETYTDTESITQRAQAQVMLANIVDSGQDPKARAEAANLLGVLRLVNTFLDPSQAATYLTSAAEDFRRAIVLAPEHSHAKYNLEVTLLRLRDQLAQSGASGQSPQGGVGSGSGARRPGSGY
jgi:hypothetical protein